MTSSMTAPNQRTLGNEITLVGEGVHTGESTQVTFKPAPAGHGIVFRRADVADSPPIPASVRSVTGTELGTTLGVDSVEVRTVEHLLAALYCSEIDNALVEVSGPEIPVLDGSFTPFLTAIEEAGAVEQEEAAIVFSLEGPVHADAGGGTRYVAAPGDRLSVAATIDFEHPLIGRSFGSFFADVVTFGSEIAPARTFGFEADADGLRERGLALGASLENTIVLSADAVLNEGLRFEDEFVRHKVGDLLGDLALLGGRFRGSIVAERPSHAGNVALVEAIDQAIRRSGPPAIDIGRIMDFLPHRYPFLLVDRILDYVPGESIVGIKNVTINEPFFQGHFPGHPIMPGVLILEAMAQCGGLLMMDEVESPENSVVYFMTMDGVKFRKPVTPGDQLVFEMKVLQMRRGVCRIAGRGVVDGKTVAEAEFKARLMDR